MRPSLCNHIVNNMVRYVHPISSICLVKSAIAILVTDTILSSQFLCICFYRIADSGLEVSSLGAFRIEPNVSIFDPYGNSRALHSRAFRIEPFTKASFNTYKIKSSIFSWAFIFALFTNNSFPFFYSKTKKWMIVRRYDLLIFPLLSRPFANDFFGWRVHRLKNVCKGHSRRRMD